MMKRKTVKRFMRRVDHKCLFRHQGTTNSRQLFGKPPGYWLLVGVDGVANNHGWLVRLHFDGKEVLRVYPRANHKKIAYAGRPA